MIPVPDLKRPVIKTGAALCAAVAVLGFGASLPAHAGQLRPLGQAASAATKQQSRSALPVPPLSAPPLSATTLPPAPSLDLPIDCEIGGGRGRCHIAFYPDHDETDGLKDYQCGKRTYSTVTTKHGKAHAGTDFAVLDATALDQWQNGGPAVKAAAGGTVFNTRRGMRDTFNASPSSRDACGNAVVLRHAGDWFTAYCHMQAGSVVVNSGDTVLAGDTIGRVGLSGNSNFPHVHFMVFHRDQSKRDQNGRDQSKRDQSETDTYYDPYSGTPLGAVTCGAPQTPFWSDTAWQQMPYKAVQIVKVGFTDKRPRIASVIRGQRNKTVLQWDAYEPILGFAYMLGAYEGVRVQIAVLDKDNNRLAGGNRIIPKTKRSELSILSLRENKAFQDYLLKAGRAPLGPIRMLVRVQDPDGKTLAQALARSTLSVSDQSQP